MNHNNLAAFSVTRIADSQLFAIESSSGSVCVSSDYRELLRFLVKTPDVLDSALRVVWNLGDLVELLKLVLPAQSVAELEGDDHRSDWTDNGVHYRLYHQQDKYFGVHAGGYGAEVTIFELDQFFPDIPAHETIEEVQALCDQLTDTFSALGATRISSLNSPVAALESAGILDAIYAGMPDPDSIPGDVKAYASGADTWGAWQSAYQVGYWKKAYSYDVASCYPSHAVKLVSLTGAEYKYSKTMLDGAFYGFLKGTLTINPAHPFAFCSPIVFPVGSELTTNPVGKLKTGQYDAFTLDQVRFIERNGMGSFDIKSGWFIFPKSGVRPLDRVMSELYARRAESPLMSQVAKRVIDGMIGRLGEYRNGAPTEKTNPVYHSTIRANASLQVGQFLIDNALTSRELISVNTDGFHSTRDISLPRKARMGCWRSEEPEPLIVLSSDNIYEGERCQYLLDKIKANPGYTKFGNESLPALSTGQDRIFDRFPFNGGELLRTKFQSRPMEVR